MNLPHLRSYRIAHSRDYISGFDWQLRLTGQPVGGYAAMDDGYGGKFLHRKHAIRAGEIFVETGILPCFQTDERIETYRQAERHRALGAVRGDRRAAA